MVALISIRVFGMNLFPICTQTTRIPESPNLRFKGFPSINLDNLLVIWILGGYCFFLPSFLIYKSFISFLYIDISLIT